MLLLFFTLKLLQFNLGILILLCQKEPQEDGLGGEGGTEGNIGGDVGLIPPYPTFIPPGNNKILLRRNAFISYLTMCIVSNFSGNCQ